MVMQTSNPDVYAIGDVACFPLKLTGGALVRQEHATCCRWVGGGGVAGSREPIVLKSLLNG